MLSSSVHINSNVKRRFNGVDISSRQIVQKSLYLSHCVRVCVFLSGDLCVLLAKLDADGFSLFVFFLSQMALFCQRCIITARIYSMNFCAFPFLSNWILSTHKKIFTCLSEGFFLSVCRPRRCNFSCFFCLLV